MSRGALVAPGLAAACGVAALVGGCGEAGRAPARAPGGTVAVVLDAHGRPLARVHGDGAVITTTADGRGGWFVTGDFRHLGGLPRRGLARIDATGRVDPRWRAYLARNVEQASIGVELAAGYGRLFAFGIYRVNGVRRRGSAALDATTGALIRGWHPRSRYLPTALAVAPRRVLEGRGDQAAAYTPSSGRRLRRFHVRTHVTGEGIGVDALGVRGRSVWVGGYFDRINGTPRVGLARVRLRTGRLVRGWRPPTFRDAGPCRCNRAVVELAPTRRRLFVVGTFNHVGRVRARGGLVALDARTGRLTRFRAAAPGRDLGGNPGGYDAVAVLGRRVFVTGLFGAAHAHDFAVLDARTGRRLRSWHPARRRANPLDVTGSGRRVLVSGERLGD